MSIDLEVWTKREGSLSDLELGTGWDDEGDSYVRAGDGWLVDVLQPRQADPSEAPAELRDAAPDVRYCVYLRLEPSGAPPEGRAALVSVVEAVGGAWGGAALHPETGKVMTWE